jgi:Uma2 family endonuclease
LADEPAEIVGGSENSRYVGSDDGWADGCVDGNRLAEGSRVGFKVAEGEEVVVGDVKVQTQKTLEETMEDEDKCVSLLLEILSTAKQQSDDILQVCNGCSMANLEYLEWPK